MCPILFHSCPELFVFLPFFWVAWRFVSKPCLRPRSSSSVWRQSIRIQRRPGSPWILGRESRQSRIQWKKNPLPKLVGWFCFWMGMKVKKTYLNKVGGGWFWGVKSLLAVAIFFTRCCGFSMRETREASPPASQFRQVEVNN